jgi:sulfide dehydrogenase [flavocytochrome c] flavoprotein subunit
MSKLSRRDFIKLLGAGAATSTGLFGPTARAFAAGSPHVVVLGGGIGGSTFAKYLRIADPNVRITLIERNRDYITCPRSNDVIVGFHTLDEITFNHDTIRDKYGINVLIDEVTGVDTDRREVRTAGGERLVYDRLLVSPGIDFRWDTIEGYDPEVAETRIPHAWKAGPQTLLLKRQLQALPEGGTVLIAAPPNPFRCPPGPYERASLIAEYLQQHNPRAKVLILDAKDRFTKDGPFKKAWERLYGYGTDYSMIEWVSRSQGGNLLSVDAQGMRVEAEGGAFSADLINVVPAQKAGRLAFDMGLTDSSGWCPIDRRTFESQQVANVHVIGDACIADAMPKSGYAANTQAKVAAWAISDLLNGREAGEPTWSNTCYSLAGSHYGVSISAVYELHEGRIRGVPNSGGLSPIDDNPARPVLEAVYQKNWHRTFVKDVFS